MAIKHNARVKYKLGTPKPSKYEGKPDCANIVVEINGQEQRIYVDYGSQDWNIAAAYKQGDPVEVLEDKGKFKILGAGITIQPASETAPSPQAQATTQKTKEASDEKAKKWADTYAVIFNHLAEKLPVTTPAEVVGSAASTVFIALTRN